MEIMNTLTMLITMAILGMTIYSYGRHSVEGTPVRVSVFENNVRLEWIFLGIVLLAAVFIRVWDFGSMPYGMNQDGAMAAIDAKALADHGTDRLGMYMPVHFTAWGYGQMSVLLSYMMIPFIKLFGLNPVTARLPILIVSILAIYVIYRLVRDIWGVTAAQIAVLLVAFTPWHFIQSRWALDCNMFPHMMLFGVFFLYKGIRHKRWNLYVSMIFFALCMYSYGVSFYTVPVFLLITCIYLLNKKLIRVRDLLICIGVYFFISWPIYLTMIINTFRWSTIETPFFTIPFFPNSVRSNDILFFSDHFFDQLLENIKSLFSVFMKGDSLPWNTVDGFGTIYLCMVPFVFLGMFSGIRTIVSRLRSKETPDETTGDSQDTEADKDEPVKEKEPCRVGVCLFAFWMITALFCGIITSSVNTNRINILMYPLIVFAAIGVYFVYTHRKRLIYVIAAMCLVLGIFFTFTYYSQEYTDSMSDIFMGGFGECLQDLDEAGCEEYDIDVKCHWTESVQVLELQTMFYLSVDSEFYQSDAFSQKYRFFYSEGMTFEPKAHVGYVVPASRVGEFDEDVFTVFTHGKYAAAISKDTQN